ncbi:cysteine desulfurase [Phormidium yuhuli AB48]|uniref:Cysteine desulfurase n=1 Tax=Phormidium yuhuli AB48 TaxID=2940671 RepID=A0ABY5ATB8_9CYAN|nr:cysteine desulfurase family protein [Phormidium yuhuli]USR92462.1 cysteine desulfurase [Phormidium yuhuli AB48]
MPPIYLDYHATTPVDPRVIDVMTDSLTHHFGNASSIDHPYGDRAAAQVKTAKQHLATLIGASPRDILFTSGATESINLAIQGCLRDTPLQILLNPLEHKAVLDTCEAIAQRGQAQLHYLTPSATGQLNLEEIDRYCGQGIDLLCVMAANNEIGTIYPVEAIAKIAQTHQVPYLCDGSQAVGKLPFQFRDWGITFLALSGHKFYAPQGCGALVVRPQTPLTPLLYGGGQQRGQRPGTLNLPGIVALGEAARRRTLEMEADESRIARQRDRLQSILQANIPQLHINGDLDHRLAGNLHISIPGIPNSAIIARVRDRLAISTGSACTSGVETPSHVLRAIGLSDSAIEGSLRIGLGKFTRDADLDEAATILSQALLAIQKIMSR